jgi:hypothetical protein
MEEEVVMVVVMVAIEVEIVVAEVEIVVAEVVIVVVETAVSMPPLKRMKHLPMLRSIL